MIKYFYKKIYRLRFIALLLLVSNFTLLYDIYIRDINIKSIVGESLNKHLHSQLIEANTRLIEANKIIKSPCILRGTDSVIIYW